MDLKGKRVLVVGLGKSGVASALFLQEHGARVTVSDAKSGDELRERNSGAAGSRHYGRNRRTWRAHLPRPGPDRGQPGRSDGCCRRWCRRERWEFR